MVLARGSPRPGLMGWPQKSQSCSLLRWAGTHSIGVRAFSALEGYAGRNWRNGAGFSWSGWENAQLTSQFSSEIGTKADAKQQIGASVRAGRYFVALLHRKAFAVCARLRVLKVVAGFLTG